MADVLNDPNNSKNSKMLFRFVLLTISNIRHSNRLHEAEKFLETFKPILNSTDLSEPEPNFWFEWPVKTQPSLLDFNEIPQKPDKNHRNASNLPGKELPEPNPNSVQQLSLPFLTVFNRNSPRDQNLLGPKQVASRLNITLANLRALSNRGDLPVIFRDGNGTRFYSPDDVEALLHRSFIYGEYQVDKKAKLS